MSATTHRARRRGATGPTRVERSEETRAALLRAASHTICELGMHGASIDRIAAEAGYTKGAFYAHFASKEDLFLVMLDQHFATELARLEAVLTGAGDPVEETRSAAEGFLDHIALDPEWRRLYQEFATHAARHDTFRAEFAARHRALRERIATLLARWATGLGLTPPVPPADVAAMAFFMADGFLLDQMIDPELDTALYGKMFEIFIHGLMAMTDSAG